MRSVLHRGRARLAALERRTLASVGLIAAALLGFASLADRVLDGEPHGFDTRVLLALRVAGDASDPIGPGWFEEAMRDITALGSTSVLALVTIAVVGFLALTARRRTALLLTVAVLGAFALNHLLKWVFDRPRPDLVPHGAQVYTQSFPSGHAMISAAVYLTVGALLARTQSTPAAQAWLLGVAISLALLVGISRVYLGVHWPTDVLAGWALGAAWALAWAMLMAHLQRRRGNHGEPTSGA